MPIAKVQLPDGRIGKFEVPDGTSPEQVLQFAQANIPAAAERTGLEQGVRAVGMAGKGIADSVLETVGAIPDLVAAGMRGVGLPAPEKGFYTNKLKEVYRAVGEKLASPLNDYLRSVGIDLGKESAENALERGAYGAGKGAADAASIFVPAAAASKALKAGTVGQGVASTLASQPGLQLTAGAVGGAMGEATESPLLGAGAALAVPVVAGIGQVLKAPIHSALTPEQGRLAEAAVKEGIHLTPAQRTGSRPLQAMESVFGTTPLTSGPQRAMMEGQRTAFNRAVLKRAGIDADMATPDVLEAAARKLGKQFEDLSAKTMVNLDDTFMKDLNKVSSQYASKLPTNVRPIVESYVADLAQFADGMPGVVYQQARSDLSRQAKAVANSDPMLSHTLKGIQKALDKAARSSMGDDIGRAWDEVRRQYGNLKVIEKAMTGTQAEQAAGNIPITAFANAVKGQNPQAYARGAGDLNELSRVGSAFLRDAVPNSGTPERLMMASLLSGGAGIVGGAVNPIAGAATFVGPRLAQMGYNLPMVQNYLTKGAGAGTNAAKTAVPVGIEQLKTMLLAEQLAKTP